MPIAAVLAHAILTAQPQLFLLDPAQSLRNFSFYGGWEFPGAAGNIELAEEAGRRFVRACMSFAAASRYAGVEWHGSFEAATAVGFWIRLHQQSSCIIRLTDSTGQVLQGSFSAAPGRWQRVEVPVSQRAFTAHWSGANDGIIHQPIKRLFVGVGRTPKPATFDIGPIYARLTQIPEQTWLAQFEIDPPLGVVFRGGAAHVRLCLYNRLTSPRPVRVELLSQRPESAPEAIARASSPALKPGWPEGLPKPLTLKATIPCPSLDYRLLRAVASDSSGRHELAQSAIAAVPRPVHFGRPEPNCFFGLQVGMQWQAAEAIGAKAVRIFQAWRYMEPRPGQMVWAWLDAQLPKARRRNMQVLLTLQAHAPTWAAWKVPGKPDLSRLPAPDRLGDWARFVRAVVERYSPYIDVLEIENEPDLTCWYQRKLPFADGVEAYVRILRAAHAAAKSAAPDLPIAGLCVSGGDFRRNLSYARAVMEKAAPLLDLFTGHPYASPRYFGEARKALWPLQNKLREKLQMALDMMASFSRPRRMWIGELGWGLDRREDPLSPASLNFAACIARALITARTVPGVEKFLYFTMSGCYERGCEYGLFRATAPGRHTPDFPLPAAQAYAICAWLLHGARPGQLTEPAPGIHQATFRIPGLRRTVHCLWADAEASFDIPSSLRRAHWLDAFGRPLHPGPRLKLSALPVYAVALD